MNTADATARGRVAQSRPNSAELRYPLAEWVLYVMHGDSARAYSDNRSTDTLK